MKHEVVLCVQESRDFFFLLLRSVLMGFRPQTTSPFLLLVQKKWTKENDAPLSATILIIDPLAGQSVVRTRRSQ